jgi:hypothetical protein
VRLIQRVSAWLGWAMLFAVAVLLILEGTGSIGATWREWIATAARWVAQPSIAAWLAAVVGAVLGLVALAILVVQFAQAPMTRATVTVQRSAAGATVVSPVVVRRAAVQRLKGVGGIVDATPFSHGRRLDLRIRLERGANAPQVEERARATLDASFWVMLGIPPQPIDLTLTYATVLATTEIIN